MKLGAPGPAAAAGDEDAWWHELLDAPGVEVPAAEWFADIVDCTLRADGGPSVVDVAGDEHWPWAAAA